MTASYLLHKHHICYPSYLTNKSLPPRTHKHVHAHPHTHTHRFSWQRHSRVSYSVPHIGQCSRKKAGQCQPNSRPRFSEDCGSARMCGDQINCPPVCLQWDLHKTGEWMCTWQWIMWINLGILGVKTSCSLFGRGKTYLNSGLAKWLVSRRCLYPLEEGQNLPELCQWASERRSWRRPSLWPKSSIPPRWPGPPPSHQHPLVCLLPDYWRGCSPSGPPGRKNNNNLHEEMEHNEDK